MDGRLMDRREDEGWGTREDGWGTREQQTGGEDQEKLVEVKTEKQRLMDIRVKLV